MTDSNTQPGEAEQAAPIVYVREVDVADLKADAAAQNVDLPEDGVFYAVHTEDGVRRAVFSDRQSAFDAAENHGAMPVSVH